MKLNIGKKATIFVVSALMVMAVIFSFTQVNAYKGNSAVKGPDYSDERHAAMEKAFDEQDYDAWKTLMTENGRTPKVVEIITKDNFAKFAQAHVAAENGDFETANALRAELGLGNGMRMGQRDGSGLGKRDGSGKMNAKGKGKNRANCQNLVQ